MSDDACDAWVAEVLLPELGWMKVPGHWPNDITADHQALRFAMKWGGTDTRIYREKMEAEDCR
jgi:hypothetical protein